MILEVCVDSYKSLLTAKKAGADRIELCSALNIGGLTPSYGLMKQAKDLEGIEIFVMIRPRSGNFLYDENEYETMKEDIALARDMGFDGIVTGILKRDGKIDLERMAELVEEAYPLKVVLHRAFDHAKNPEEDMEELIQMGIVRILTSGQRETALEGRSYIANLEEKYGDRITIMPGSGVKKSNIGELYKTTGCREYHMSGKVNIGSPREYRENINKIKIDESEFIVESADYDKIRAARRVLDQIVEREK